MTYADEGERNVRFRIKDEGWRLGWEAWEYVDQKLRERYKNTSFMEEVQREIIESRGLSREERRRRLAEERERRLEEDRGRWHLELNYIVEGPDGRRLGALGKPSGERYTRKGTYKKGAYLVARDAPEEEAGLVETALVRKENPRVKALDWLLGVIPIVNPFGFLVIPSYVAEVGGRPVLRLRRRKSLLRGRFEVERVGELPEGEEDLLLASVLMVFMEAFNTSH